MRGIMVMMVILLLTTGCWNRKEADQVDYVLAVGIDLNKEGSLALTIQTPVLESLQPKKGGGEGEKVKTLSMKGLTTFEAIRNYISISGRKLFWGHTQVYLISEEAARLGVERYIDFFAADPELRGTSQVAVVKGAAKDLLEAKTQINVIPASYLSDLVKSSVLNGKTPNVSFSDFNRMLAEPTGSQPFLPVMQLLEQSEYDRQIVGLDTKSSEGKDQSPLVLTGGTAVFRGTKLVGFLNQRETRGLLWTKNSLQSSIVTLRAGEDSMVSLEVIGIPKAQQRVEVVDDKVFCKVNIQLEVNIGDRSGYVDLGDESELYRLEEKLEDAIVHEVELAFHKTQELKSDVFAFGNELSDKSPQQWEKVKEDWEDKLLPRAELKVEVNGKIRRTSRTLYSPWVRKENK